jgi:hypothetical protein
MLGEDPGLEELVHAVDGQEAGHISGQVLRYRHLPFENNNFFARYLTIRVNAEIRLSLFQISSLLHFLMI